MTLPIRYFRLVATAQEAQTVDALLAAEGFLGRQEAVYGLARRLQSGPYALGRSVAAQFGRVYIQDKSSLLPPLCLNPGVGDTVVDMCASPGSKTGVLSHLVGPAGLVVANEPNPARLETLRANMRHLGLPNVITLSERGEDLRLGENGASHILVDAPCSGWGTEAKNPNVRQIWHEGNVQGLIALQRRLLTRAAQLVRPNGCLVYSTCTTNPQENAEQIAWAVQELDLEVEPLSAPDGVECESRGLQDGLLQVQGQKSQSQGFFIARLRKKSPSETRKRPAGTWTALLSSSVQEATSEVVQRLPGIDGRCLETGRVWAFGEKLFYAPQQVPEILPAQVPWHGVFLGRRKKENILVDPRARWLLPSAPGGSALDVGELAELEALLRGQRLPCQREAKRIGLYWRGLALGWAAVKGKQAVWTAK
ncbi:MAG: RsmB/NOP family class I SAM-dependent RNA methyltransferase [Thermodesulfobacteriota bacterium]